MATTLRNTVWNVAVQVPTTRAILSGGWLGPIAASNLTVFLINLDASANVNLIVETSEDGIHVDSSETTTVTVPPGESRSVRDTHPQASFWRVSAQSLGGGPVNVQAGLTILRDF